MVATTSSWLPLGFDQWTPAAQAATLFFLTFISEDLTTVSASFLASAGKINWHAGFWGCYFGIWVGDAGLYGLARGVGHPLLKRPWARRLFKPEAVDRCEHWFAKKGAWVLVSSRFVPGMRLPSYLAAGFLRFSFWRFVGVTGLVGLVWTLLLFGLAGVFGAKLLAWLDHWHLGGWSLLVGVVLLFLAVRSAEKLLDRESRRRMSAAIGRWLRWEFWPAWLFYPPVGIFCLWLGVRYRGFMLPTVSNPGIFSGGIVGESKHLIQRELSLTSPEFTADAWLIEGKTVAERMRSVESLCAQANLAVPFIIKPDVGQRGAGVKLIRSLEQAEECLRRTTAPLVIQCYAPGPHEAGLFYYRFPHEPCGRLFAITEKVFPCVTGDGVNTLEELIWRDSRARFIADKYLARHGARRDEVLPAGTRLKLVEAGNHAQGCIFLDGWRLWSAELEARIDEISRQLNEFYFGRYDVRYANEEEFRAGRGFQIIELNGAASEATSIYDARNSVWTAYATLYRQWDLAFAIGAANRARGLQPTPLSAVWRKWREYAREAATYPAAD